MAESAADGDDGDLDGVHEEDDDDGEEGIQGHVQHDLWGYDDGYEEDEEEDSTEDEETVSPPNPIWTNSYSHSPIPSGNPHSLKEDPARRSPCDPSPAKKLVPRSHSAASSSSTASTSTSTSTSSYASDSHFPPTLPTRRSSISTSSTYRPRIRPPMSSKSCHRNSTSRVDSPTPSPSQSTAHVTIAPIAPTILKTGSRTHYGAPGGWVEGFGDEGGSDDGLWGSNSRSCDYNGAEEERHIQERQVGPQIEHGGGATAEGTSKPVELVYVPPLGSHYMRSRHDTGLGIGLGIGIENKESCRSRSGDYLAELLAHAHTRRGRRLSEDGDRRHDAGGEFSLGSDDGQRRTRMRQHYANMKKVSVEDDNVIESRPFDLDKGEDPASVELVLPSVVVKHPEGEDNKFPEGCQRSCSCENQCGYTDVPGDLQSHRHNEDEPRGRITGGVDWSQSVSYSYSNSRSRSRSRSRTPSPAILSQSISPTSLPAPPLCSSCPPTIVSSDPTCRPVQHTFPSILPTSSSSGLLSPPVRGRSSRSHQDLYSEQTQPAPRGRSSTRVIPSSDYRDRGRSASQVSSSLGSSLSPEGGIGFVASSASAYAGGRGEKDKECRRSGGGEKERGREISRSRRQCRESNYEDGISKVHGKEEGAKIGSATALSVAPALPSVKSTGPLSPATELSSSGSSTILPSHQSAMTESTDSQMHLQTPTSTRTPANSPVLARHTPTVGAVGNVSPPSRCDPRKSCPPAPPVSVSVSVIAAQPTVRPRPSSSVMVEVEGRCNVSCEPRHSVERVPEQTTVPSPSSPRSPVLLRSPESPTNVLGHGETTIVGKAVGMVSSAGAFLGLWHHHASSDDGSGSPAFGAAPAREFEA